MAILRLSQIMSSYISFKINCVAISTFNEEVFKLQLYTPFSSFFLNLSGKLIYAILSPGQIDLEIPPIYTDCSGITEYIGVNGLSRIKHKYHLLLKLNHVFYNMCNFFSSIFRIVIFVGLLQEGDK